MPASASPQTSQQGGALLGPLKGVIFFFTGGQTSDLPSPKFELESFQVSVLFIYLFVDFIYLNEPLALLGMWNYFPREDHDQPAHLFSSLAPQMFPAHWLLAALAASCPIILWFQGLHKS